MEGDSGGRGRGRGRGGARDVDGVTWENGGGCPVVTEVDCAAFRGGGFWKENVSGRCG